MQKSYTQISNAIKHWLPTRYFGAHLDLAQANCSNLLSDAITNQTLLQAICANYSFSDLDDLYTFTNAPIVPEVKQGLIDRTNITEAEFEAIYNGNLGVYLNQSYDLIDRTFNCSYGDTLVQNCSAHQLTLLQWSTGAVTNTFPPSLNNS